MRNKQKRILFIGNCLLGNKVFTSDLKKVLDRIKYIKTDTIYIEWKDYMPYPVSFLQKKLGMAFETLCVIRQKIKEVDFSLYDMVIAQGFEIGWVINNNVKHIPCIMFHDATPTCSHELLWKYKYNGRIHKTRSVILFLIYKLFFKNIFRNIDKFFPMTNWCEKSLVRDFAIPADRVESGIVGIDLKEWRVSDRNDNKDKIQLLFVGNNDFRSKGGEFLLSLYSRLSDRVGLTIVSNDKTLDAMCFPPGVYRLKNVAHDAMPDIFGEADIFIFPTYKDCLGLVQIEALASGLPLISRDIGGVSDAVKDGYNGYLMPYASTEGEWIQRIRYLANHPEERKRMGLNSRKIAEEKYSLEKFEKTVYSAINALIE